MVIFAQTNGRLYNMNYIEKFEKEGDTKIKFFIQMVDNLYKNSQILILETKHIII